ncbi:DUF1285 domain-containing protein [Bowmanella denitrificans]|uniref:DUF1285 domain-containing protein n=1 Tax=Bowmanella denitrificans TaxID=366582 RepID=UPI001FE3C988|nr:DUF1285 domain-containing protein [Bowmanella denitrificans]
MDLQRLQSQLAQDNVALPPVEDWHPAYCGEMPLEIRHNGSWHYQGSPIGRIALVKLLSRVLKREQDNYFLVTPVEKLGIQVADVPFLVTAWHQINNQLVFTTNVDESYPVDFSHPVELMVDRVSGERLPYMLVRRNLYARLHQNVFYQLVELGKPIQQEGQNHLIVQSGDYRFSLGTL